MSTDTVSRLLWPSLRRFSAATAILRLALLAKRKAAIPAMRLGDSAALSGPGSISGSGSNSEESGCSSASSAVLLSFPTNLEHVWRAGRSTGLSVSRAWV